MSAIRIDLYSEVSCPWCVIGHHRLDKVLAERFTGLSVDIVHHPVFLIPDCPREGQRIADVMRAKYGVSDPTQLWARPELEARASGLYLDLSRQPFAWPTKNAHTLIRLARERGTQHQVAGDLYTAYFHEARNISDPDVLSDIASRQGFDRGEAHRLVQDPVERALTELEAAHSTAQGVRSVPHFVFGAGVALNGGRSEDELAAAIEKVAHDASEFQS